jgi:solute carrier family 25 folate transporter 32
MYHNEGLLSFYSGLAPALLGLTHVAVQFPLYEQFKRYFTGAGLGQRKDGEKLQPLGVIAASCLSKICASSATYPHEVIRTRLQTQQRVIMPTISAEGMTFRSTLKQPLDSGRPPGNGSGGSSGPRYRGVINTFKTILREEGWLAFYAGMGTNMIRAVPASATTLLVYEIMVEFLTKTKEEGERKLMLRSLLE